jgi:hypothetical protein
MLVSAALLVLVAPASWAQLTPYSQNFELLNPASPTALSNVGFQVFGNVFDGNSGANPPYGVFKYGYGAFPAPNGGPAFSAVASGEGGVPQGLQYITVYSDYNCCGPVLGVPQGHFDTSAPFDVVESIVFQSQVIGAANIGQTWVLQFDAKQPAAAGCNTTPTTDCIAFIKTLDPNNGFITTNLVTFDSTNLSSLNWSTHSISINLSAPALQGQLLQFGFASFTQGTGTTPFGNSGVFYDNISFAQAPDGDSDGVPDATDNCPAVANANQADTDSDLRGNACDNCSTRANNTGANAQCDSDGDGFGNRCDGDLNNNGSTNAQDTTLYRQQLSQPSVPPTYNKADINCSGAVNAQDTTLFRQLLAAPPGPGATP